MAAYRLTGALRGCESGDVWIADGVITRTRPPGPVEDVPGVAYPGLVDAHAHPGLSHTAAPAGGALQVVVEGRDRAWLIGLVLSAGRHLVAVEPPDLAQEAAASAKQALTSYDC